MTTRIPEIRLFIYMCVYCLHLNPTWFSSRELIFDSRNETDATRRIKRSDDKCRRPSRYYLLDRYTTNTRYFETWWYDRVRSIRGPYAIIYRNDKKIHIYYGHNMFNRVIFRLEFRLLLLLLLFLSCACWRFVYKHAVNWSGRIVVTNVGWYRFNIRFNDEYNSSWISYRITQPTLNDQVN